MYNKIKKLCDEKNISIRKLEADTGLSNGSVNKWNDCIPRADSLQAVADYLGVTTKYLLSKDE